MKKVNANGFIGGIATAVLKMYYAKATETADAETRKLITEAVHNAIAAPVARRKQGDQIDLTNVLANRELFDDMMHRLADTAIKLSCKGIHGNPKKLHPIQRHAAIYIANMVRRSPACKWSFWNPEDRKPIADALHHYGCIRYTTAFYGRA